MHVLVIYFRLRGMDGEQYAHVCDELAPAFAAVPGLIEKVWLANAETGVYGGVYIWEDRSAMERFTQSDLFKTVASHPNLADITATDFSIMEAPTRVTSRKAAQAA